MNKLKSKPPLPEINYTAEGDLIRWTVVHPPEKKQSELLGGVFIGLFGLGLVGILATILIRPFYEYGRFEWDLFLSHSLPVLGFLLLASILVIVGMSSVLKYFRTATGNLRTILEMDQDRLVCYEPGSGVKERASTWNPFPN